MGVADREFEYRGSNRRRRFTLGQSGNALIALITLNIIFFLLILTANVFNLYTHQGQPGALGFDATHWFGLPAELTQLAQKPWTVLTFMFSHGGGAVSFFLILSMLSNMLWLWMFGFILQDLSGNNFIFPVYIYGGLAGAIVFIAASYTIPGIRQALPGLMLLGSTTGTIALAAAVTSINPQYRIFRNIGTGLPIWILAAVFLVLKFLDIARSLNPYPFAYLAAAAAGYLFVYYLKRGKDASVWMNKSYDTLSNLFTPSKKSAATLPVKEKIFYNSGNREPYKKTAIITQKRVDDILDKINQRGYDYLTEEEKTILKKAAEEDSL